MDLRKPSAKFNPDSQHRISLPTKVSRKPSLSSAPNVFCAVCQRSFCAAYAFYGSLVPPLRQHVSPEHGLYLFHVCIFSHTTELGTEPAVGLFVDWVISYGLKSLPGFEVLNPFHSPKVWMAVRIKPRGDEVFKLFTDIRFFFFFFCGRHPGSSFGRAGFCSGTCSALFHPLYSHEKGQERDSRGMKPG